MYLYSHICEHLSVCWRKKKEGRAGGGNELNCLCCCYSNRSQLTQAVFRKEEDTEQASDGRTEKREKEERFSRGE